VSSVRFGDHGSAFVVIFAPICRRQNLVLEKKFNYSISLDATVGYSTSTSEI
jgi:hypothetical protein